jgi:hypothetical protein
MMATSPKDNSKKMKQKLKTLLSKRPRVSLKVPRLLRRKKKDEVLDEAIQGLPRITNETVAEHREEVLSSARKYIYPLTHSKHRVVIISAILVVAGLVLFFAYCLLALYKFNSSSTFIYRITQVIPFPVAKAGPSFVSYEDYLFELRHYMHYYETQQKVNFGDKQGREQLQTFRKQALDIVVNGAYVKQLAKDHDISVTDQELNDAIRIVRSQNRLGSDDQVFADVLKEFWGWSVNDFRRELRGQMLAQKVVATLDTETMARAKEAFAKIQAGEDFALIAKAYSADPAAKDTGGDYGYAIDKADRDLPPTVIDQLFKMREGEISSIVSTGNSLEILRLKTIEGSKVRAAHISFPFKSINVYIEPLREEHKPNLLINP